MSDLVERLTEQRTVNLSDIVQMRFLLDEYSVLHHEAAARILELEGAMAKLLEDANAYKAAMTANFERAITAEARIQTLEAALKPFAEVAKQMDASAVEFLRATQPDPSAAMTDDEIAELYHPSHEIRLSSGELRNPVTVTVGDLRHARTALNHEAGT